MDIGTISSRYAKALFSLAKDKGQESRVYDDMKMLADSFSMEPELRGALSNPIVSVPEKVKLLTAAGGIEVCELYTRFINLVLAHKRETLLPFIAYIYIHLYRKEKKITRVRFDTAVTVDDAVKSHLQYGPDLLQLDAGMDSFQLLAQDGGDFTHFYLFCHTSSFLSVFE